MPMQILDSMKLTRVERTRTTVHVEPKRNKSHIFYAVGPYDERFQASPTGHTKCGRKTYVPLRTAKSTDTKCKLCFRD